MSAGMEGEGLGIQNLPQVRIVRAQDMLVLTFGFQNLRIEQQGRTGRFLVQDVPPEPGKLLVTFPPQHLVEQAYFQPATSAPNSPLKPTDSDANTGLQAPGPQPIRALAAGRSTLVFLVREGQSVPFTVDGLLSAMRTLDLHVVVAAKQQPGLVIAAPTIEQTWSDLVFEGPGLGRWRRPGDATARYRLVRSVATIGARYGPDMAIQAASASEISALVGRVRSELLSGGPVLAAATLPEPEHPFTGQAGVRTGVELPFRLFLSPHDGAAWAHSTAPVEHDERTELWHTRLAVRIAAPGRAPAVDELTAKGRTVRAIWARDFGILDPKYKYDAVQQQLPPFDGSADVPDKTIMRMSLTAYDRMSIVHQTSNFKRKVSKPDTSVVSYVPPPVEVDNLMLSSVGGWLDSHVNWAEVPVGFTLQEWRHVATLGRDHYVRVVYAGYLFPFGHRASLVKITERKFDPAAPGTPAYLYQRMFVVVRQPTRTYSKKTPLFLQDPDQPTRQGDRLELLSPFTSVQLTTLVTPDLDEPQQLVINPPTSHPLFFPTVGSQPFMFKAIAVGLDGKTVEFRTPLLFLSSALNNKGSVFAVRKVYDTEPTRTRAELSRQAVAMAPGGGRNDDTRVDVTELMWGGDAPDGLAVGGTQEPVFVPRVQEATAVIPAVSAMSGNTGSSKVRYPTHYAKNGFTSTAGSPNLGELFLEVVGNTEMNFNEQRDRAGGLVAPSVAVTALSRKTGPVGGKLDIVAGNDFSAKDFFEALDAKLFGVIDLADLVVAAGLDDRIKVPSFVTEAVNAVTGLISDLQRFWNGLEKFVTAANEERQAILQTVTNAVAAAHGLFDEVQGYVENFSTGSADFSLVANAVNDASDNLELLVSEFKPRWDPGLAALIRKVRDQVAHWKGQVGQASAPAVAGGISPLQQLPEDLANGISLPESFSTHLDWSPDIQSVGFDGAGVPQEKALFWPHTQDDHKGRFSLSLDLRGSRAGGLSAGADGACTLEEFDLNLIAPATFIELDFERIRFTASTDKKPDVEVAFREVRFVGVLSFVETLRDLIPLDGFSDPPGLDVTKTGIIASYSLPLPNIAVGVFSLENLALAANLRVPFVGEPLQVGFSFCTRESPFRLTVSQFGGGGFLGITIQPDGVKIFEASFEFGAAVSLDFGVASGSLSVMAGIYFRMEDDEAALTGYFRARGEADILAIISLCIELYLSLTYEFSSRKAVGRASIIVEIEILMFSQSVEITCEKKFGGANSDPTFEELMAPYQDAAGNDVRPWDEYCKAFAGVSS
jgi:hypothetical protein